MRAMTQVSLNGAWRIARAHGLQLREEQYKQLWIKGWLMMYELQDSDMVEGMLAVLWDGVTAISAFDFDW